MKGLVAVGIAMLFVCGAYLAMARDSSKMRRILVFGDSLSEGPFLKQSEAWPMRLIDKLRADGLDYEVMNASQTGGTTDDGLHRLGPHLKHKIDIFILELGINDVFHGAPIVQIRRNLQEIIDRVKRAHPNVRIVICGLNIPNRSSDDYIGDLAKMYADLAVENDSALVASLLGGVLGDPALNLPDGLHPNAAGQKVLAENVWRVLEPIARETARNPPARVK